MIIVYGQCHFWVPPPGGLGGGWGRVCHNPATTWWKSRVSIVGFCEIHQKEYMNGPVFGNLKWKRISQEEVEVIRILEE